MRAKIKLIGKAADCEITQADFDYAKEWIRTIVFERRVWTPRHALVRAIDGAVIEDIAQNYDPTEFKWIENGWTDDHCELCEHKVKQGDIGWTPDERHWLCVSCYDILHASNQEGAALSSEAHDQ